MPFAPTETTTQATFIISGEPPMDSHLGPDATMEPFKAVAAIADRRLVELLVYGWIISRHTGRKTKTTHMARFDRVDLGFEADPEAHTDDWVPTVVPDWVARLAQVCEMAAAL